MNTQIVGRSKALILTPTQHTTELTPKHLIHSPSDLLIVDDNLSFLSSKDGYLVIEICVEWLIMRFGMCE